MFEAIALAAVLHLPADGAALTERLAESTKGYAPSLYKGRWYHKKWERSRKCIMHRESKYDYRAANKSSSARGAYQFLDSQWRDGLVWMMLDEGGNKKEIKSLRDKPIHHWSRYWQDRAFFTAWRHGQGKHHWYYPGSRCY
jgi:hypothetical protein